MRIAITFDALAELEADTLIMGLFEDTAEFDGHVAQADQSLKGLISELAAESSAGNKERILAIHPADALPVKRVVLMGLGKQGGFTAEKCRRACGQAATQARDLGAAQVALALPGKAMEILSSSLAVQAAVEGILLATYKSVHHKSEAPKNNVIREVLFCAYDQGEQDALEAAIRQGEIFADATLTTRDLINQPSNFMSPGHFADIARAMAAKEGLAIEVLEEEAITGLGMGALLGVSRGSAEPPRFVVLDHPGQGANPKTVVLVGKGI
ncbi:MAG: leucyl aminopeptidase family protein, partial [Planctomycetes bacterium]|nr:leucyl aminopeptidase family protein [Planctomycetota bacterium]